MPRSGSGGSTRRDRFIRFKIIPPLTARLSAAPALILRAVYDIIKYNTRRRGRQRNLWKFEGALEKRMPPRAAAPYHAARVRGWENDDLFPVQFLEV